MGKISTTLVFAAVILIMAGVGLGADETERQGYVVYMGSVRPDLVSHTDVLQRHHDLLSSLLNSEELARQVRFRSYGKSFDGFAAYLLPHEVESLEANPDVVSVFLNKKQPLATTRSWDFLGMPETVKRNIPVESDLIVGMLDSGIYMGAPAFSDNGYGPPPKRWKGICQAGANFSGCNNKVIGARAYAIMHKELVTSPADTQGHGTHTASTVAGASVKGASLYGIGKGTARGGVPSARLAIYKVCGTEGDEFCYDADLLSGFDDAISDGVDFISVSIGGPPDEYFKDSISIGSYHAMEHGILTSASAGNHGPSSGSVSNVAPWVLTVTATGGAKQYKTTVGLGNGVNFTGISINTFSPRKKAYPLTSAWIARNSSDEGANLFPGSCGEGSLMPKKVKGKIVFCDYGTAGGDSAIHDLEGIGMISQQDDEFVTAMIGFEFIIPAAEVDKKTGNAIHAYINSTKNPEAVIYKTETVVVDAPFVAAFASRGPNTISNTVLKPDVGAPGVNILASFSKFPSISGNLKDRRHQIYNIMSGTSMAAPHATAAAVYVKSFHPTWSPAAIKSALMTTASPMKVEDSLRGYSHGAGQINPVAALDPGLVYDMSPDDFVAFLCHEGYNGIMLNIVTGQNQTCPMSPAEGQDAVNYPSFNLQARPGQKISAVFHRTITNVGPAARVVYQAVVKVPAAGFEIKVVPERLVFQRVEEKKTFKVIIQGPPLTPGGGVLAGWLWWKGSFGHQVASPIVISTTGLWS